MQAQFSKRKDQFLGILLAIVLVIAGYMMYKHGRMITGPFIFGDELEYFSYARDLFTGSDLSSHTQYGILYPAIGAFFFNFGDVETVYRLLRIFNIAIFISSAIPAFLLARSWFPNSIMRFLFPLFTATAPFSGFVHLIWADPLYYTLFLWTAFILLCFYRQPRVTMGIVGGILLSLLFHAKPGAGIVVQFAAFLSLMTLLVITSSGKRKRLLIPILILLLSCALLTVPWMMRNLSLGVGPIGYKGVSIEVDRSIAELGYLNLGKDILLSIFYQLAYVFIGTWGLLGVLFIAPFILWRNLIKEHLTLIVFAVLCIIGSILLTAIGVSAFHGLGYWMISGKYLSVICPLLILLAIGLISRIPNHSIKKRLTLISIILVIITAIATPLGMVIPISFVVNSDLSLATWIIDKGMVIWRGQYFPSIDERVIFAIAYGAIGLILIWVSKWRSILPFFFILILAGSNLTTLAEHEFVGIIGNSQNGFNNVMRFVQRKEFGNKKIAFDSEFNDCNISFIPRFWTAKDKVYFLDLKEILNSRKPPRNANYFISMKKLCLPVVYKSKGFFLYNTNSEHSTALPRNLKHQL